jgi:tight adherence protein B
MNPLETVLFTLGTLVLALLATTSLFPAAVRRLEWIAGRRSEQLRRDFLFLSPERVMAVLLVPGAALGCFVWRATGSGWTFLPAAILPVVLSGAGVKRFRRRRITKVLAQLPGFLDTLAGNVRAGRSLPEALVGSVPLLPGGIREEAAWLVRLIRLGTPVPDALSAWEARLPSPEIVLAVRPLRIASSRGGNIASLLERTRDILRSRQRQREKMRSMTAQARLQAWVLTLLPPAFLLVLSGMEEGFLAAVTGTPAGRLLLAAAGTLQVCGWLLIRRILGGGA